MFKTNEQLLGRGRMSQFQLSWEENVFFLKYESIYQKVFENIFTTNDHLLGRGLMGL